MFASFTLASNKFPSGNHSSLRLVPLLTLTHEEHLIANDTKKPRSTRPHRQSRIANLGSMMPKDEMFVGPRVAEHYLFEKTKAFIAVNLQAKKRKPRWGVNVHTASLILLF